MIITDCGELLAISGLRTRNFITYIETPRINADVLDIRKSFVVEVFPN